MVLIILSIKNVCEFSAQIELLASVITGGIGYLYVCWFAKLGALETLVKVARKDNS
jgi:hypothetical protein